MCGIAGVYNPAGVPDLHPALAALAHRGPDDEGQFVDPQGDQAGGVALGARRLAIIDLEGGRQPVASEDAQVVAVQNGEIYNYVELAAQLQGLGHTFHTRSDSEVLVHAWEQWGAGCVERLRGMFALAIYDRRQRSLFLARDRFGIKPLYLHGDERFLTFASELPALLSLLPEQPEIDPAPLAHLLSLGWAPAPGALWQGVAHLPPGHARLVTPAGSRQWAYWQPAAVLQDGPRSWAEAGERLLDLLRQSVRLHLRSDVPVGALLSGGLDSSLLVALMRETGHPDLHTFNISFDDPSLVLKAGPAFDETPYAAAAAAHLGVQHHNLRFGLDAFELLPELVTAYGQPVGSATHIAIWLLYRACAQAGLKVILTGEGADELFGGYPWYTGEARLAAARRWPRPLQWLAGRLARPLGISSAAADLLRHPRSNLEERYGRWLSPFSAAAALPWLHPELRARASVALPWRLPEPAPRHALTLLDWQSRLPDFINLEVDRMSMAHSVEARVPYLDHQLWEEVLAWEVKPPPKERQEKALLRQAGRDLLPATIMRRRKQGLATPHAAWWRLPQLPDWAMDCLRPAALERAGLFDPPAVNALLAAHRRGQANYATPLTAILTAQLWRRE